MYNKIYLIIRNKIFNLDTEEVIYKIFDNNILVSSIAKEELLNRDLSNINIPDEILQCIVLKLSIEQIYDLIINHKGSKLSELASIEFDKILEDAKNNYLEAYYDKVNEGKKPKLTLLK